jgi:hypothetical protein
VHARLIGEAEPSEAELSEAPRTKKSLITILSVVNIITLYL